LGRSSRIKKPKVTNKSAIFLWPGVKGGETSGESDGADWARGGGNRKGDNCVEKTVSGISLQERGTGNARLWLVNGWEKQVDAVHSKKKKANFLVRKEGAGGGWL